MKKRIEIMLSEDNIKKLRFLKQEKGKSISSIVDEVLKKTLKNIRI